MKSSILSGIHFQPGLAAVLIITCPPQSQVAFVVLIPADTKAQWSSVVGAAHIRRGLD